MTDVFLNSKFIGEVDDPKKFVEDVKNLRRKKELSIFLNIYHHLEANEILIESGKGRARRPLILVKDGKSTFTDDMLKDLVEKKISWQDLVDQGVIEYLDSMEEENAFVSLSEEELTDEHTHLEISPVAILGICTSLVPYSNFGGSSRLIRGSKIQKQSLGLYSANYLMRMDSDRSVLDYPQNPIVNTFMHDVFNYDKHPCGQNFTIAVMSYEGYNMSDAIILNKGSVERGLARSTYFKPYVLEELRYSGGLTDEVSIPDKETKGYKSEGDYRYLEKDGIVYTEAEVNEDDVLIGRTSPPRFLGGLDEFSVAANIRRESSSAVKRGDSGKIDMVLLTENESGNKLVQVRLREQRIPEIGDKFASRHGQKGVIGMIVPEENVPFTSKGVKPDLIFSPHSIPGRMTVSHLLEIIAGKVGSLKGSQVDCTTFDTPSEESLRNDLKELGFREDGTEVMYNPITGEQMTARIYVGNIYYLKLKHMVANKLHSRASGRIQLLTRQPIEGRARGGGLRLGEMEKDCLVAHGTSLLLKERFDSDKTILHVCENCGMLALYDEYKNKKMCLRCGSNVNISPVEISYGFKLLLDELKSLCIYPELKLGGKF